MIWIAQRDNGVLFKSAPGGGFSSVPDLAGLVTTCSKTGTTLVEAPTGATVTKADHAFKTVPLEWIENYMGPNLANVDFIRKVLIDDAATKLTAGKTDTARHKALLAAIGDIPSADGAGEVTGTFVGKIG